MSMAKQQMERIECSEHGSAFTTFVCEHLLVNPKQTWYSCSPTDEDLWPDSWCELCHELFRPEGEWNDKNSTGLKAKLLCHRCYESQRSQGEWISVPD